MALADALAPEGIAFALGQHRRGVRPVQREQARIPAHRDNAQGADGAGGRVHGGKVFGDPGVGIEAVDHREPLGKVRGLCGEVGGAAAAQDQHVDCVFHGLGLFGGQNVCAGGQGMNPGGVTAGKDGGKLHVRVLAHRALHPAAQVAVTHDANADTHSYFPPLNAFKSGARPFLRYKNSTRRAP